MNSSALTQSGSNFQKIGNFYLAIDLVHLPTQDAENSMGFHVGQLIQTGFNRLRTVSRGRGTAIRTLYLPSTG